MNTSQENDELLRILLADDEVEQPPLSSYPLQSQAGREAFLEAFAYVGEPALFAAVAHIWDSLAEPKNARCIQIGLQAGTGGKGRAALRKFLMKFLEDVLGPPISPLPKGVDFEDLDQWNEAVHAIWADMRAAEEQTATRYAWILNGGCGGDPEGSPTA